VATPLTLDDCTRLMHARAARPVSDSPLAPIDGSVRAGAIGEVCDVDGCNEVVFVDFGKGAIACTPDELEVV
jgi:hypothetical protein